jgi:hypothetical protein
MVLTPLHRLALQSQRGIDTQGELERYRKDDEFSSERDAEIAELRYQTLERIRQEKLTAVCEEAKEVVRLMCVGVDPRLCKVALPWSKHADEVLGRPSTTPG